MLWEVGRHVGQLGGWDPRDGRTGQAGAEAAAGDWVLTLTVFSSPGGSMESW